MRKQHLLRLVLIAAAALAAAPGSLVTDAAGPAAPGGPADFNGDRYADLAIGVPGESVDGAASAGAVNVFYGTAGAGLSAANNQLWSQSGGVIPDGSEPDEQFGYRVAPGDFNKDGFVDLAVGVPYEDIGASVNAGVVNVLYGGTSGLTVTYSQMLTQIPLADDPETDDTFGAALTTGDFNGDGYADLAVGVPNEDLGDPAVNSAGAVNVLYGSSSGLSDAHNQFLHQGAGTYGIEAGDHFGQAVRSGDFNGDGYSDLAVGVPGQDIGVPDAGVVQVFLGSASGLSTGPGTGQVFSQGEDEILDTPEAGDGFGSAFAAQDFDADGYTDLAVGVPDEDLGGAAEGVVHVLFGSNQGLTGVGSQLWSQDETGDPDGAESNDHFGFRLTAGDLNCDGYADLAVGAPYEDVGEGGVVDAGAVTILYGSGAGPVGQDSQFLYQGMSNITGALEENDGFGFALAAGDFDGDGCGDLVVGVPYEEIGSPTIENAGVVHVLPGSPAGLLTEPDQVWHQNKTDVEGEAQAGDLFGYAVAAIPRTYHVRLYAPLVLR
jgi:hypothetical protein